MFINIKSEDISIMAKKSLRIDNKMLGGALIVALVIQFVLPKVGLGGLSSVGTLIYLLVALYHLFLA